MALGLINPATGLLTESLHRQVCASVAQGAQIRLGGAPLPGPGYFYPPTLLTAVGGDRGPGRRGGAANRQRLDLRPWRIGLDPGPRPPLHHQQ